MRFFSILFVLFCIILLACNKDDCSNTLFGIPYPNTGLTAEQCTPICECSGKVSKMFTPEELTNLKNYQLTQPYQEISQNPYAIPAPNIPDGVCAVVIENLNSKTYHLENFESAAAAKSAGAIVTHYNACGVCSTLDDLAVYGGNLDVGADVRLCGILHLASPFDSLVTCIEAIGFTKPCAQIWAYNVKNTQNACFDVCISNNTYNNNDGSLSECIQCDETMSGPVFKAVAGRTRRNTGIANAICRKCEEVQIVQHNYPL